MSATVNNVHHRHWQDVGVRATNVAEQFQASRISSCLGHRNGGTENGVGAQPCLVRGSIQIDHGLVNEALVVGFDAAQCVSDLFVDVLNGLQHALTQVAVTAVAQFVGLMHTSRRTGGDACCTVGTVIKEYFTLDSGVAAGVQNLASENVHNSSHSGLLAN